MNTATTIQRAYQFRYYPTAAQRITLNQYFGAARWMWNACFKTAWYGRELFFAPRFAATSKTCSNCKAVMNSMPLHIRYWICPVCGAFHDRDVNAATAVKDDPKGGRPECYAHRGQQSPSAHQFTLTGMLVPIEVRTKPIRQSNNLEMINGLT